MYPTQCQILRSLLPAIILLSATVLSPATPLSAEVIWRGDFETGTTEQWRGAPISDSIKVVTEPVREGKYALRIDGTNAVRKGKLDRLEFQHQPREPGTAEGTERFFGWSVFVPKKLTDDFHSVGYFETRNSWRQLMSFEVHGEDIIYSTRVPYARHWTGKGKFTPGRWHDFAVHVLWSRDPAKGLVEAWFDGEQVVRRTMTATLLDENVAFFQIGLMRDTSDVPETIIIDQVIEATTLEEVTPPRLVENLKPAATMKSGAPADLDTRHRFVREPLAIVADDAARRSHTHNCKGVANLVPFVVVIERVRVAPATNCASVRHHAANVTEASTADRRTRRS